MKIDLMSTIEGSLLEGFFPAGWDLARVWSALCVRSLFDSYKINPGQPARADLEACPDSTAGIPPENASWLKRTAWRIHRYNQYMHVRQRGNALSIAFGLSTLKQILRSWW
jgi:hypothetical protein